MTKINLLMGFVAAASLSACAASADKVQIAAASDEPIADRSHAIKLHDHSTHNLKTQGQIETVKPGASVTLRSGRNDQIDPKALSLTKPSLSIASRSD